MRELADAQIETRDMLPLLSQPAYKDVGWKNYPISRWVYECGFYVGCHHALDPDAIQYVVHVLSETVGKYQDIYEVAHESPALSHA